LRRGLGNLLLLANFIFTQRNKLIWTGAIVGRATIVSRVDYISEKQWRADEKMHCVAEPIGPKGRYGYVLTNVVRLKTPMPCNGKLNFFTVAGVGKSQAKSSKTI